MIDIENIRNTDFSISNDIIYLDSATTTLKPTSVIKTFLELYENNYGSIGRSSNMQTYVNSELYSNARSKIKKFLNFDDSYELIFTSGCTDSYNLCVELLDQIEIESVFLSKTSHHSNNLPFISLCNSKKINYKWLEMNKDFSPNIESIKLNTDKRNVFSLDIVSNIIGVDHKVNNLVKYIKSIYKNSLVVLDASQAVGHIDFTNELWYSDIINFSSHKMLGPFGIGAFVIKKALLNILYPSRYGGGMIEEPEKLRAYKGISGYEPGTINWITAVVWGNAIDYLINLDHVNLYKYVNDLTQYLINKITDIPGIEIISPAKNNIGLVSIYFKDYHSHDICSYLEENNIMIRGGNLCASFLLKHFNISSCVRVSPYFYNTYEEIDFFIKTIQNII